MRPSTANTASEPVAAGRQADFGKYASSLYAAAAATGLVAGLLLWAAGIADWPDRIWFLGTLPSLFALVLQMANSLRRGDIGLDAIALLSMTAALVFGEELAANVVGLMYAGGQLLEDYAAGRAERTMTALLGRVAATAMRLVDGHLAEVPVEDIVPGDRLLIRHGEVLPVDGTLATAEAVLDLSALTGESRPVRLATGGEVLSGSTSVGPAFELTATRSASQSTYATIVALVAEARVRKPPVQRLADRYALVFLGLTLAIATAAWVASGDHMRALSVLVVATPCPLILAVPVAMISGLSRAAGRGILIKGGLPLENLARVQSVIFDKTGTLTHGRASLLATTVLGDVSEPEILRLAASLDQASGHVLAEALISAARLRGLPLSVPVDVSERAGAGITGRIGPQQVSLGGRDYVAEVANLDAGRLPAAVDDLGSTHVWVAVDNAMVGILHLEDRLRSDAASIVSGLRSEGIERIVLASGDRSALVQQIGAAAQVDAFYGDLTPEAKVAIVRSEADRAPVMMVGDGVNDAPALAVATVGVALGARGEAAASEAADVVILVDQLEPVVDGVRVARRTMQIALQSVIVGMGLSVAAMLAGALGYLPPVAGAFLQEAIDVAVILNALRALR